MDLDKIDYTDELAQFGTRAEAAYPYLKLKLIEENYHLFEGAIGPDRFQYFAVARASEAGIACADFIDKYEIQNHYRHQYYEDGMALIKLCNEQAIEKFDGKPAYMKYWNLALSSDDKKRMAFYIIPFFEPLVEWFAVKTTVSVSDLSKQMNSSTTIAAHEKIRVKGLHKSIAEFIEGNKINDVRRWSGISMGHAKELLRFRDWVNTFIQLSPAPPTLVDFITDFLNKSTHIDATMNSGTGDIKLFYSVNGRHYSVELFWIFFKNYHVEQAFERTDYRERLTYFRRIVPQLEVLRDEHYEKLRTIYDVPATIAVVVKSAANNSISNIESRIRDLERYFNEQTAEKGKSARHPSTFTLEEKIIETFEHAGRIIHQTPSLHQDKGEEGIRDEFLTRLHDFAEHSVVASGETVNKEGKTDICVRTVSGITSFIAECKIWTGKAKFHEAITQLIDRYVDWYLERSALLLFVRRRDFTSILRTVRTELQTHRYFIRLAEDHSNTHLSIWYRQRDDKERHLRVDIMAFHFFPSSSKRPTSNKRLATKSKSKKPELKKSNSAESRVPRKVATFIRPSNSRAITGKKKKIDLSKRTDAETGKPKQAKSKADKTNQKATKKTI